MLPENMMLIGRGQSKQHKLATPASALILNLPINITNCITFCLICQVPICRVNSSNLYFIYFVLIFLPFPLLRLQYVAVKEWQFGHKTIRFSREWSLEFPFI